MSIIDLGVGQTDNREQESELREYVERRGWTCTLYRDHGQSGAKNDRPALNALLADLRRRKIHVVVVWALDRLARSLKQLLSIAEEYRDLGVDLVSLKQNVDTTLPAGGLTFQVSGAVAEFELRYYKSESRQEWRRHGDLESMSADRHGGNSMLPTSKK